MSDEKSVLPNNVVDMDNDRDPQFCSDYSNDIYVYMRTAETCYAAKNYLEDGQQIDITSTMRSIVIDWLVQVAEEYKLASETLYLSVNYLDRYLSMGPSIPRNKLQLLGVVAMFVASKFEEVYKPSIDEFIYISDHSYSKQEVFDCERSLLDVLSFNLVAPTIKSFLIRFLRASSADSHVAMLANYLCELSLLEYAFIKYSPSIIALTTVSLALHTFEQPAWTPNLAFYSGIKCTDIRGCMQELYVLFARFYSNHHNLQAVKEKYSCTKFLRVSITAPPQTLPILE